MQARAEETRGIVLDTAVTTFGSLGYTNITLADLIARSKVTKGAFYFHFANREAVATAVISETDARLRQLTAVQWCPQSDSNRHWADFKSAASANWAIGARRPEGRLP